MTRSFMFSLRSLAIALFGASQAVATIPYTPVPMTPPVLGPAVPKPTEVFGKEYSHEFDHSAVPPGGLPDPEQVIQWDGIGGTTDGVDFTGSRPDWTPDQEIDAIANHRDVWFQEILDDAAHLIFSHDDEVSSFGGPAVGHFPGFIPPGGPVLLSNGNLIGGAGEVSIEEAGVYAAPSTQSTWATQPEVNGMPLPRDVDGLEVYGIEPLDDTLLGDTDKYSLDIDALSGVSVWNATGTPYIGHGAIVGVVTSLLGPLMGAETLPFDNADGEAVINLDALMVQDRVGSMDDFDRDPNGAVDSILFSIRQIISAADPSGYYATGSELFYLNSDGTFGFLKHGGHTWDKAYALTDLMVLGPDGTPNVKTVIDINAIEAVTQVPEPAGVALLAGLMGSIAAMRWRLG